ncbi:MAG: helix-turn-helix domain-containing protein [Actinomycetota bacterium]
MSSAVRHDVEVLGDPASAAAVLDPLRSRILRALSRPGSATTVARDLGETRQKVNYHLRTLERHGLVRLVDERPRRGLTERMMEASAEAYVVGPDALGPLAVDPERTDRLSSRYLLAVAGRLISEVGRLARAADEAGKPLPTLTIDTEVRFVDADSRAAFTHELAAAVTELVARHHDEDAPDGRWHRLIVAAHSRPPTPEEDTP